MSKWTFSIIKEEFIRRKCTLVSTKYEQPHASLDYICPQGHPCKISWNSFKRGHGCKKCAQQMIGKKFSISIEKVKEIFLEKNCELISTEYNNSRQKLQYKCPCGKTNNFKSLSNFTSKVFPCNHLYKKRMLGENHPRWNFNLTQKEREKGRKNLKYNLWTISVYKKNNFRCVICKEKKSLNAHHLNGYCWDKDARTDINNGITLCKECHKAFHYLFGNGKNTREQFLEFIRLIKFIFHFWKIPRHIPETFPLP